MAAGPEKRDTGDQIVELPEGVTPIEYTLAANGSDSSSPIVIEETMLVAFNGTDVYLQGLSYYFPEAFVIGTLGEDSKVLVPSGQYLGEDSYGKEYLIALSGNTKEGFALEENIVFNFDTETGVLTLEGIYGESGTKDTSELYDCFDSAVYTPGALALPFVQLPDGVEPETWTFEGALGNGMGDYNDLQFATEVAFDGADIYVKGLAYYFKDGWVKGTLDAQTGIVTFPAGQLVGRDDYGSEYMVGYDGQQTCDYQYAYDAQANTLTQVTPYILESKSKTGLDLEGEITAWTLWINSQLYKGEPVIEEPVTIPKGLAIQTYLFKSNELIETEDDDVTGVAPNNAMSVRKAYKMKEYRFQTQVGFDGKDVYIKGFSEDISDFWAKGTLSEDGQTVTIPANQYIGSTSIETSFGTYTFPYYLTADEATSNDYADIIFNYDAETKSFATLQTLVINGSKHVFKPYKTFSGATITKLEDFAATPADPTIESFKIKDVKFPQAVFNIPAMDVDGNDLLTSKLFYTIRVEKDGQTEPFTVLISEYRDVEEDMVEIPYEYYDNYDIYLGGRKFYFNPADEPATWTKFGVQSIYYGGNERHESNIVWVETGTGIASLAQDQKGAVIYNIAGQRVQKAQKGLYIVNGKKVLR